MGDKKLDSWNAPFDLNRDGKMSPEEKALRDVTIMGMLDDDDEDFGGGGGGGGCCLLTLLMIISVPGSIIGLIVYGISSIV